MKKIWNFLRSMRFGVILLLLIALCSVAGSIIPQQREVAYYAENYTQLHPTILALQLDNIFESWYFIVLLALLCLNLTLCSILRGVSLMRDHRFVQRAGLLPDAKKLTPEGVEKLRAHLTEDLRCKAVPAGESTVYTKHLFGRYGTFITHLAILLTVVFGALALYLPTLTDETCMPGESIRMADGTDIHVESFRIENDAGDLDFSSEITVTLPDGRKSDLQRIRVNYPMHFGPYKIYQQTYGTAGSITATNLASGVSEDIPLTESVFLTLDGVRTASGMTRSIPAMSRMRTATSPSSTTWSAAMRTRSIRCRWRKTGSISPCSPSRATISRSAACAFTSTTRSTIPACASSTRPRSSTPCCSRPSRS